MDSTLAIKSTLKAFKNPSNPKNDTLLGKRLRDCNPHILGVKRSYPKEFQIMRNVVFPRNSQGMPLWMDDIIGSLGLYLDVFILRTKYLPPGYIEPIGVYTVIGETKQIEIAKHYLSYLYGSIHAFYKLYQEILASKAKLDRKAARKDKEYKRKFTEDIRIESSKYRKQLVRTIITTLNSLLEDNKINQNDAFYKGLAHQERIDKFLKAKYSNTWRQSLSNNS